eukprot:14794971-Alexandrium_andersonii.AAC.1
MPSFWTRARVVPCRSRTVQYKITKPIMETTSVSVLHPARCKQWCCPSNVHDARAARSCAAHKGGGDILAPGEGGGQRVPTTPCLRRCAASALKAPWLNITHLIWLRP